MKPCPLIVAYKAVDETPPSLRWLARFMEGGKPLPIIFNAETEDAVVANAETWWRLEQERRSAATDYRRAAVGKRRKPKGDAPETEQPIPETAA